MEIQLCAFLLQAIIALHQLSTVVEARAELLGLEHEHIPNEYLVVVRGLNEGSGETARRNLEQLQAFVESVKSTEDGGEIKFKEKLLFHSLGVLQVEIHSELAMNALLNHPLVDFVETNKIGRAQSSSAVQCSQERTGSDVWGLSRISSRGRPTYNDSTQYQYDSQAGTGVEVYVIDTGVYIEHSEFGGKASHGYTVPAWASEGRSDLHGHGTHVAGTIAGRTYGVAKAAHVIAVKACNVDGVCGEMNLLQAVRWACNDFRSKTQSLGRRRVKGVANMSLRLLRAPSEILDQTIRLCVDNDNLPFVVGAGNEDIDSCGYSPARSSSVITVGATDVLDKLWSNSCYGSCVDILAPGVDIKSAAIAGPSQTMVMTGTSMATPHVAGAVASLLSTLEEQPSPHFVKALLIEASTKNVINVEYPSHAGLAPNRLLYSGCQGAGYGKLMRSLINF